MPSHDFLRQDDFAALFAARDLRELIALANALGDGAAFWALLRPADPKGQTLLSAKDHESMDPLPASQIAGLNIPVGNRVAGLAVPWARSFLRLLTYQNDWMGKTGVVLPVWEAGTVVGVIGASKTDRSALSLLQGVGLAMRRLHQVTELSRDVEGAKYLLPRSEKSVVLAASTGKILCGTTGGLAVVERLRVNQREGVLPVVLRNAIDQEVRQVVMDDIVANLSRLALTEPTTVSPLVSIRFTRKMRDETGAADMAARLETLTPREKKVYRLLTTGLRDKEIADQLSVSYHTAKHHVSHILQKLRCSDRLLLMARAGKPAERPVFENSTKGAPVGIHHVAPLPVVPPLPPTKYLRVPRRPDDAMGVAPAVDSTSQAGAACGPLTDAGAENSGD